MKVLVGNISKETGEELVRNLFSGTAGSVNSISIPLHPKTGKNRGYALVEMNNALEAEQAVRDLSGVMLDGRLMAISVVERTVSNHKWYQFWAR